MVAPNQLSVQAITRLHRRMISSSERVTELLDAARSEKVRLYGGIGAQNVVRVALVEELSRGQLVLRSESLAEVDRQAYFNFSLHSSRYFFAVSSLSAAGDSRFLAPVPKAIFEVERREAARVQPRFEQGLPSRVELRVDGLQPAICHVRDCSYDGLGVATPISLEFENGSQCLVRFLDGDRGGEIAFASTRHNFLVDAETRHVGMTVSQVRDAGLIPIERRRRILGPETRLDLLRRRLGVTGALARNAVRRVDSGRRRSAEVEVVEFANEEGSKLRGIVNSVGERCGAPAIVIPPAWGKTKETLLPLAETMLAGFKKAGLPLVVLRFDGTNRRGESYIFSECRHPGSEYLRFSFSAAVTDIHSALRFLRESPEFQTTSAVLATFSLAAVEGRRAVATDPYGMIKGWISVVGVPDLQSGLRSVSGGVDYAFGLRSGIHFGRHQLVGVNADMDFTGSDALDHGLVFLEDAKREMAKIDVPVCWIHGRDDAWIDIRRVRELLSAGNNANRRLIEVPTGHQLRTSSEALEVFQLVTSEAARFVAGKPIRPALPHLGRLRLIRKAEQKRRPAAGFDAKEFWSDYLLGRDRTLGMELMTETSAYRMLMRVQRELLSMKPTDVILDLGSGTGGFVQNIENVRLAPRRIIEIDLVAAALLRMRGRADCPATSQILRLFVADLGSVSSALPLRNACADGAIASLLLSYLDSPEHLLHEAFRVLRKGGKIVVSSLRPDADISKIYSVGVREVLSGDLMEKLGEDFEKFPRLQREFLNSAARILDWEELGVFRFWEPEELGELLRSAGFRSVTVRNTFGHPPQAVVACGIRG